MSWIAGVRRLVAHELRGGRTVYAALFLTQVAISVGIGALRTFGSGGGSALGTMDVCGVLSLVVFSHAYAGRVVHRDLRDGTSQFVETLPVTRTQVLLAKWLTLFGLVMATQVSLLAVVFLFLPSALLVPSLLVKVAGVSLVAGAVCAAQAWALAFFGRYRWPLVWLAQCTAILVQSVWKVNVAQVAPLGVVFRQSSAVDSVGSLQLPLTVVWIVGLTAVGALAGLWNEGHLARALARRMSSRERGAMVGAAVAVGVGVAVVSQQQTDGVFSIKRAASAGDVVHVEIYSSFEDAEEAAVDVQGALADAIGALHADDEVDPFVVGLRRGIRGSRSRTGRIGSKEGHYLLVNPDAPGFSWDHAKARLFAQWMGKRSVDRIAAPDIHWFFDGFVHVATRGTPPLDSATRLACAAWGVKRSPVGLVDNWYVAHDLFDDDIADAMADTMVDLARSRVGDAPLFAFARTFLEEPTPQSALANLGEWIDPAPERFERMTGLSPAQLEAELRERVSQLPAHIRAVVDGEAAPEATVEIVDDGGGKSLEITVGLGPDPRHPTVVRYAEAGVWDDGPAMSATREVAGALEEPVPVRIDESWVVGSRVQWRFERWSEPLGCMLVTPWIRVTL